MSIQSIQPMHSKTSALPSAGPGRTLSRVAAALLLPVVLLLGQSCGGSGGGSSLATLCIDFASTGQPTAGTVSSRLSAQSSCELAEVEILATDINDVFAFKSTVKYDPDTAVFLGFSLVDSVLESDGGDVTVVAEEEVFGTITLGATRIASTGGVNVTGTQVLLKLAFARFAGTGRSGEFELGTECLLNSATPPTPMTGLVCRGGTLIVR